jgi:hypothetical protein
MQIFIMVMISHDWLPGFEYTFLSLVSLAVLTALSVLFGISLPPLYANISMAAPYLLHGTSLLKA